MTQQIVDTEYQTRSFVPKKARTGTMVRLESGAVGRMLRSPISPTSLDHPEMPQKPLFEAYATRGCVSSSHIRIAKLHKDEEFPLKKPQSHRGFRIDRSAEPRIVPHLHEVGGQRLGLGLMNFTWYRRMFWSSQEVGRE